MKHLTNPLILSAVVIMLFMCQVAYGQSYLTAYKATDATTTINFGWTFQEIFGVVLTATAANAAVQIYNSTDTTGTLLVSLSTDTSTSTVSLVPPLPILMSTNTGYIYVVNGHAIVYGR